MVINLFEKRDNGDFPREYLEWLSDNRSRYIADDYENNQWLYECGFCWREVIPVNKKDQSCPRCGKDIIIHRNPEEIPWRN